MSLTFTLKKGETYNLTIAPQDAAGAIASLVSGPNVNVSDATILTPGPVQPQADGTFKCAVKAIKNGAADIHVSAVGTGPLAGDASGTVTLPLAVSLVLSGQVSSGG